MWHYLAPGSGIFFNIGKTVALSSHQDAREIGCSYCLSNSKITECLIKQGRERGYDSIQFPTHKEGGIVKYELVDTHVADPLAPMGACPDAENAHRYRRGWKGRLQCHCNSSHDQLNCDGGRVLPAVARLQVSM
jgi:hypothetical protein